MSISPEVFDDLRAAYAAGDLVVFAGAGISAAAGLPGWLHLARALRDRLERERRPAEVVAEIDELIRQRRLVDALTAIKQALGSHEFDIAIEKTVDDEAIPVPEVARAIAELEPKLRAVLTTNLDRFLERAFEGRWEALSDPPENLGQRRRYVLKLHGTRLDRRNWVFTREQYDQATFGWPQRRSVFEALFRTYPILFVGYGLADDDLDQTLAATRALAGPNPPHHFAVLPAPVLPYRRSKLEKTGLRLLVYDNHGEVPGILRSILREGGGGHVDSENVPDGEAYTDLVLPLKVDVQALHSETGVPAPRMWPLDPSLDGLNRRLNQMSARNKRLVAIVREADKNGIYIAELSNALHLDRADTLARAEEMAKLDFLVLLQLTEWNVRLSERFQRILATLSSTSVDELLR